MFWSKDKKKCILKFYYIKVGCKGGIYFTDMLTSVQYSCRDALSVCAFARCAWLRVGDYLYSRVTRESLASHSQTSRNLARSSRKRAKPFVKHARRESDTVCVIYTIQTILLVRCVQILFISTCT